MVSLKKRNLMVLGALLSVSSCSRPQSWWQDGFPIEENASHEDLSSDSDVAGDHEEKHFQEIYMMQADPESMEFGHVCENPKEWEQRYERKDFSRNRHQGKARWGNSNGGHGEHYWDFNHSGGDREVQSTPLLITPTAANRQLSVEEDAEVLEAKISNLSRTRSKEAQDFLESFHREFGVLPGDYLGFGAEQWQLSRPKKTRKEAPGNDT